MPGLELGYCARSGEVDVRLLGAASVLDEAAAFTQAALGENIFATGTESLEQVVVRLLTARGETLATAESCTGGFIAHRVTNVAGASAVFLGRNRELRQRGQNRPARRAGIADRRRKER